MESKIVSTFMFSEPHEQDLLWLKFNIESDFISEWIIIESSYTFQGKRKGLFLQDILKQERFKPFRNKVYYITLDKNYHIEYEPSIKEVLKRKIKRIFNRYLKTNYKFVTYSELASFYAEINQRQASVSYIKQKYDKNDIVLLCDTDEIFDFNEKKIKLFQDILDNNSLPIYLFRHIYCYDFDNYSNRKRYSPIVAVSSLNKKAAAHNIRHPKGQKDIVNTNNPFVFEYTSCFSKEAISKKLSSFAHVTELNKEDLSFCLRNNIALIPSNKINEEYKENKENFYTKVELDNTNSPLFLRENFELFKTSIVDNNYLENRKKNKLD